MKSIEDVTLHSKKVLLRSDLDVPINKDGTIADDHRVKAALETIQYLIEHNARVIVIGHMGRPKGTKNPSLSLKPVAKRMEELLKREVTFIEDCVGEEVENKVNSLKDGEIILLENLRFYGEEEENDTEFAKSLAKLCDIYVNNAFATSHREHASTAGVARLVEEKAAGFTLRDEIEYFNRSCASPNRPLLAIFGGAKVSTKIKAIQNVGAVADMVIVGGAMANTFIKAQGFSIGSSLFEEELLQVAKDTLSWFKNNDKQLLLPVDVVVAEELKSGIPTQTVTIENIPENMMALDIGEKSLSNFKDAIKNAKTIIWNGPMGVFEIPEFSNGTYGIVDELSNADALTVVGGGDTDLALQKTNSFDKMDFVSTAGGAFLCLLEGKTLPAIEALNS